MYKRFINWAASSVWAYPTLVVITSLWLASVVIAGVLSKGNDAFDRYAVVGGIMGGVVIVFLWAFVVDIHIPYGYTVQLTPTSEPGQFNYQGKFNGAVITSGKGYSRYNSFSSAASGARSHRKKAKHTKRPLDPEVFGAEARKKKETNV